MDPFTQKLLERTKARKDALSRKRQEWEQNASSVVKPSDSTSRNPLKKKDLNQSNGEAAGIGALKKTFEGGNEAASSRAKRQSPTKPPTAVHGKKAKTTIQPSESMVGTPRSARTAKQNRSKDSEMDRSVAPAKASQQRQKPAEMKEKKHAPSGKRAAAAGIATESIQERLARLEEQQKRKTSEVAEQKKKRQNEIASGKTARERLYENARAKDKQDIKRHSASLDEKLAMFEHAMDVPAVHKSRPSHKHREEVCLSRREPSQVEHAPAVADCQYEQIMETYDTDGYEGGTEEQTEDEGGHMEGGIEETEDEEENPFDISAILREAEAEDAMNDGYVMEQAETPSSFSNMVANAANEMKPSSSVVERDATAVVNPVAKKPSSKKKKAPQKPVRSFDDLPHTKIADDNSHSYINLAPSPAKPAVAAVQASPQRLLPNPDSASKSRSRMRRSISFSEGQGKPLYKSGYNEEASKNYDANGNCSDDSIVEVSTRDKIQDLLEQAASQQNIVLQTSQALNANEFEEKQGSPEVIEGHRLLLLATERKNACLEEVQHLKKEAGAKKPSADNPTVQPCTSRLVISGIKLPLNHDFLQVLRSGKMDLGVFHFVVLVQYGTKKIYASAAVSSFDAVEASTIPLTSKIVIHDVSHDFRLTVKVFGMHTRRLADVVGKGKKTNAKDNPSLMKNVISSFTPRKKGMEEQQASNASPKTVFRTSNFTSVGQTKIDISMIRSEKHVLCKVPGNCPLDGFIQLRIDCLPQFTAHANGFLTIFQDVGGYTAWNRRWCTMQGNAISYWRYPDEESSKAPLGHIDLRWCQNSTIGMVTRDECARPNTFEIIFRKPLATDDKPGILSTVEGHFLVTKCWISTDTKEDRTVWLRTLNRQLSDYNAWSDLEKNVGKNPKAFHVVNPTCRYNSPAKSPASVYV